MKSEWRKKSIKIKDGVCRICGGKPSEKFLNGSYVKMELDSDGICDSSDCRYKWRENQGRFARKIKRKVEK